MTLKDKVAKLCEERGLSMRELEKQAGLKSRTIQHWDESIPSADKLFSVAKALNVSVEEFWEVFDHERKAVSKVKEISVNESTTTLNPIENDILFLISNLNDKGQKMALKYIKMLIEEDEYKRYTEDTAFAAS